MSTIPLPAKLRETVSAVFGESGAAWADGFEDRLAEAVSRWQLELEAPFDDLSYSFVARATRAGEPVVLKLGVPNPELTSEFEALRAFDGDGIIRLLDADADRGMSLLERLEPGARLADEPDDDRAMAVGADVMRQLWRTPPPSHPFRSVDQWMDGLARLRPQFDGGTGPIPEALFERAVDGYATLRASAPERRLLHADLHQFNILSSDARGWTAIDPKGAVGDPGYEVGPLLSNLLLDCDDPAARLERRVQRVANETAIDAGRVLRWAFVHAVLSTCWSLEDRQPWEGGVRRARLMADALGEA